MKQPIKLTLTDSGAYFRFRQGPVKSTRSCRSWPHVAIDLDRKGRVVGIEAVPAPRSVDLRGLSRLVLAEFPLSPRQIAAILHF
jgi:hypothetical protein